MTSQVLSNMAEVLTSTFKLVGPQSIPDLLALLCLLAALSTYASRGQLWDKPDPHHRLWFERPQLKNGGPRKTNRATRNIAQKMKEADKSMVIFWGSQSGTAESFANRLARDIHARFGVGVMSADLSDYDPETIALVPQSSFVIYILSTFGEGDPSDNAQAFWEWILKTEDKLSNLCYAAFGLGNSNYKYYNRVVDMVTDALHKLGAIASMPIQKADDANGSTEEDFMRWKDDLFAFFKRDLQLEEKEAKYTATIATRFIENTEASDAQSQRQLLSHKTVAGVSATKHLRIKSSRELFTSSTRNCIHMDLDLSDQPELRYKSGDHLAVYPVNPSTEVDVLLHTLALERHTAVEIYPLDPAVKLRVPAETTVESLLRHHLEICAPVSRDTLRTLLQFAQQPQAREYLQCVSEKEAFADLLGHTYLTFGHLLQLAGGNEPGAWQHLPLSFVIESLPSTQPRYYSISSSSVTSPRQASITALVSKTALRNAPETFVYGVTSNYIRALHERSRAPDAEPAAELPTYQIEGSVSDARLYAQIRRSKFKLPAMATTPIIMISAGTGIAPFRAFIEERARFAKIGRQVGQMQLFFGCRRPDEDYIYREELEEHQRTLGEGKLRISTAFSRVDKMYVQDRVKQDARLVIELVEDGAHVYICGRAAMAREVGFVLQAAMGEYRGYSDAEVREWSEGLKRQRMWQEDVWG